MNANVKLIRHERSMQNLPPCVATIGNFDGLHLGHQAIIKQVVQKSQQLSLVPTVVTFEPTPQALLRPNQPLLRLMSFSQKSELLAKWGIRQLVCLRFNAELAKLSPQAFFETILVKKMNVKYLMVGEDFRFGHQQAGNIQTLLALGEQCDVHIEPVNPIQEKSNKISSTLIREALVRGELATARDLLGRNFSVKARVVKGAMRGRQLGFATANLAYNTASILLSGIFVSKVHINQKCHIAVTNVGTRPTVDGSRRIVEVHILDFSGNLYNKKIEVEFLHKLRDEKRFNSVELLIQQIKEDVQQTRDFFSKEPIEV